MHYGEYNITCIAESTSLVRSIVHHGESLSCIMESHGEDHCESLKGLFASKKTILFQWPRGPLYTHHLQEDCFIPIAKRVIIYSLPRRLFSVADEEPLYIYRRQKTILFPFVNIFMAARRLFSVADAEPLYIHCRQKTILFVVADPELFITARRLFLPIQSHYISIAKKAIFIQF